MRAPTGFTRLDAFEARLCLPVNAVARHPVIRDYFRLVSRLGDGMAWYALLALLPVVYGPEAVRPVLAMGVTALAGVAIYKLLKAVLVRERPFAAQAGIELFCAPLDRYSFPSGHTLHAVAFLIQLGVYFPAVMWLLMPFALSVMLSRVVLGLHYPTDVLAGGLLGWGLAGVSLALAPFWGL